MVLIWMGRKRVIRSEGRTAWHPENVKNEAGKASTGEKVHSNMGILLCLFLNFKGRGIVLHQETLPVFLGQSPWPPLPNLLQAAAGSKWILTGWTSELLISLGHPLAGSGLCGWEAAHPTQPVPGTSAYCPCGLGLPGIPGAASSGHSSHPRKVMVPLHCPLEQDQPS